MTVERNMMMASAGKVSVLPLTSFSAVQNTGANGYMMYAIPLSSGGFASVGTGYSTSTNGISFSTQSPTGLSNTPVRHGVQSSSGTIVGIGWNLSTNLGFIVRSTNNGVSWTNSVFGSNTLTWNPFSISVNSSGLFIAVGSAGYFSISSDDGITWSEPSQVPNARTLTSIICTSSGKFIAVGEGRVTGTPSGSGMSYVSTTDGVTWSAVNYMSPTNAVPTTGAYGIAQSPTTGRIVAIGDYFTGTERVFSSYSDDNGVTWSTPTGMPSSGSKNFIYSNCLACNSGGVFVSIYQVTGFYAAINKSSDGVTWNSVNYSGFDTVYTNAISCNSAGRFVIGAQTYLAPNRYAWLYSL